MTRHDGRSVDALRPVSIETGFQRFPEGSVLYRGGKTMVLVSVSIEEHVPSWMAGKGRGWVTAEYAMHPRCNPSRKRRDGRSGKVDGRSTEIQRLIGRALRAAVDFEKLGERLVTVDCDVLDADGGTRTASVTAGWVGLVLALDRLRARGLLKPGALLEPMASVSVGWVDGRPLLDLDYKEDSTADVDLNVVATQSGSIIEVQGTAEGRPVPRDQFDAMLELAVAGIGELVGHQTSALTSAGLDWQRLQG